MLTEYVGQFEWRVLGIPFGNYFAQAITKTFTIRAAQSERNLDAVANEQQEIVLILEQCNGR